MLSCGTHSVLEGRRMSICFVETILPTRIELTSNDIHGATQVNLYRDTKLLRGAHHMSVPKSI